MDKSKKILAILIFVMPNIITLVFIIFLYFQIGILPTYDNPDPKTLDYYFLIKCFFVLVLANFFIILWGILSIIITMILDIIKHKLKKSLLYILVILIVLFLYNYWIIQTLAGWWVD